MDTGRCRAGAASLLGDLTKADEANEARQVIYPAHQVICRARQDVYQGQTDVYNPHQVIYDPQTDVYRAQAVIYTPQNVIYRSDDQVDFMRVFPRFAKTVAKKRQMAVSILPQMFASAIFSGISSPTS